SRLPPRSQMYFPLLGVHCDPRRCEGFHMLEERDPGLDSVKRHVLAPDRGSHDAPLVLSLRQLQEAVAPPRREPKAIMGYKSRSLFGMVEEINTKLFLPHIQRPFVWD